MTAINPGSPSTSAAELQATVKTPQQKEASLQKTSWQSTGISDAKHNNALAGKILSQQNLATSGITTAPNKHQGITITNSWDTNNDELKESSLSSAFDKNGNMRSNTLMMDSSGDGVVDYAKASFFDNKGNLQQEITLEDADLNGTLESHSHAIDEDGNGILDKRTTVVYGDNGGISQRSVARDLNQDGVMDFAFNETFNAQGKRTSFSPSLLEGGIFGSNNQPQSDGFPGQTKPTTKPTAGWETIVDMMFSLFTGNSSSRPGSPTTGTPPQSGPSTPSKPASADGNGTNNLTPLPPTATAQFESKNSDTKNALFTYDIDDNGNISNIRQLIENSTDGLSQNQLLGEVSMKNGKPNLLLLPRGAEAVDGNKQLKMINGELHIDDGQNTNKYDGNAYFSTDAYIGGGSPFKTVTDNNGNMTIQIEDNLQADPTQNSFDDLIIKVSTNAQFEEYVSKNADLEAAWKDMKNFGTVQNHMKGEYFRLTGKGIDEQHFINGWNAVSGRRDIQDLQELTKAEWGMLHYEMHGKGEGRDVPGGAPDLEQSNNSPQKMTFKEAAQILLDNLNIADTASGGEKNNLFSREDLKALMSRPTYSSDPNSQKLKQAATILHNNSAVFQAIDVAHVGGKPDGEISAGDLSQFIKSTKIDDQYTDPKTVKDAAKILRDNLDLFDTATAGYKADDLVSKSDLEQIKNSQGLPQAIRNAAKILLESKVAFTAIDVAQNGGNPDGLIGLGDLNTFIASSKLDNTYTNPTNPKEAAKILRDNLELFDTATPGFNKDGFVSKSDLSHIMNDTTLPEAIRKAAAILFGSSASFNALDVANDAEGDTDGKISAGDLGKFIASSNLDKAYANPTNPKEAATIVYENFALFDTATDNYDRDNAISRSDLSVIQNDANLPEAIKAAAKMLLEDNAAFNQIDVAKHGGSPNGTFSIEDIKTYLGK